MTFTLAMAAGLALASTAAAATPACADLLAAPSASFTIDVQDGDGRTVPVTVFHPARPGRFVLVGFSHGAFATPGRYAAMLAPLAGAGLVVVAPTHIDSEAFRHASPPPHAETWRTRNADMALVLAAQPAIDARLKALGIRLERRRMVAMGHSYGALVAQMQGGARAIEPDGASIDRRNPAVAAVVGWSPPGPLPGLMAADGWRGLVTPTLTITGTADVLPGFIDDWRAHRASHDAAPAGKRALWVGDGIDHYFDGLFGREKPASAAAHVLFGRALASTLAFIGRHAGGPACHAGPPIAGEQFVHD